MRRLSLLALLLAGCSTMTEPSPDGGDTGIDATTIPADGGPLCTESFECDDRVACTIDRCTAEGCSNAPCADCCDEGLTCVPGFGCRVAPAPCEADSECMDEARCTLDYCEDGACRHDPNPDLCDAGEICLPAVGCIPEPPTECTDASDCAIAGAACIAEWSCQPEFGCQFVSVLDCDDGDACTADSCSEEAGGCVHLAMDGDEDGVGPGSCGGDCDDEDGTRYPGATEVCDGDDEDCDGSVDEGCCFAGGDCTTSCGTTGTVSCDGDTSVCDPPAEICNGEDDDCDGDADEDFDCAQGATRSCTTGCDTTGQQLCGAACAWGSCVAPTEVCNGIDDDCAGGADDTFACVRGTSSSCTTTCGSTGTRACLNDCSLDACTPPAEVCNGLDDNCNSAADETFTCVRGASVDCSSLDSAYDAGTATCLDDCSDWDTSSCTDCGNGVVEDGEYCDGDDLNGRSCTDIGPAYRNGVLRCQPSCVFNITGCEIWNPSGTYGTDPVPTYRCAMSSGGDYAVDYTIGSFVFSDSAGGLTVTATDLPCVLAGDPIDKATGVFNACCEVTGLCTERYCLSGTYSDDDTWTGSFDRTYTPLIEGFCYDCTSSSFATGGAR